MKILKRICIIAGCVGCVCIIATIAGMFFTSNGFSSTVDLLNSDTIEISPEDVDFSDEILKNYELENVLFMPYTVHGESYEWYVLKLQVCKDVSNKNNVTINSVRIEGISDVEYKDKEFPINKVVEFEEGNPSVAEFTIVDEINDYDMKLNKNSKIKVILNVSCELGGNIETKDIEYIFETDVRTYLVQR